MDGWSEVLRIPSNVFATDNFNNPTTIANITSLQFDSVQNFIWCGDSKGYTRSFTGSFATNSLYGNLQLYPYTKFHTSDVNSNNPIKQILSHREGILSLSGNAISFNSRRGLTKVQVTSKTFDNNADKFDNLQAMTFNCNSFNDVVVGTDTSMMKFDLNKPNVLSSFDHQQGISLLNNSGKFLTIANSNGSLDIFDPISNTTVKTFSAHNGFISNLDVRGNYIATCGYSIKPKRYHHHQPAEYMVDPLVNIYDTRIMRAIAPVPFPAGASSVRFHPKLPNIIIIASPTGQMQFVDIFDQTNVYLYQADLSIPTNTTTNTNTKPKMSNLEISENGDFLVFNDSCDNMHLWSISPSSKDFVNFPQSIEQPDIIDSNIEIIDIDANVPLSIVGMPYYKELLLSNYPNDLRFVKETAKLPEPIDIELILENETQNGRKRFFPYDKLKYGPGNIYKPYQSLKENEQNNEISIPKFISERTTTTTTTSEVDHDKYIDDSIFQYKSSGKSNKVPNCYSRLQIQYSKFGIKDFDFSYYNKTKECCGLENHTDNSYINSLLQLYRFQSSIYNRVVGSLSQEWLPNDVTTIATNPEGSSILNELGYLFDMMFKAQSNNVKIYNLSQVLNHHPNAEKLLNNNELLNLNSQQVRDLVIEFNNFLLTNLHEDFQRQFDENFNLTELKYEIEIKGNGTSCPMYDKHQGSMFSLELITPPSNMLNKMSILINNPPHYQSNNNNSDNNSLGNIRRNLNILTYLEYSMNQFKTIPCQQHNHSYPHNLEIRTSIVHLPSVLTINVNLSNPEFKIINTFTQWLVPEFYAMKSKSGNGYSFKEIDSIPSPSLMTQESGKYKYELLGYVCEINHQADIVNGGHNLVAFVKVNNDSWYLFNDFLVMPIPEEEVFDLQPSWKKPIVIMYQRQTDQPQFNYLTTPSVFGNNYDDSILYRDHFAEGIRKGHQLEYKLLTQQESPIPGSLVAIDAEFVMLKPEELEIHYDGYKKLIKPKQLSLARISVLRENGIPFIDDYIVHTSKIYDYLTNFSGIEQDDLNLTLSKRENLVTLQTAYRKLWLLLNLGVIFVGHGLYNDFRTINLQVPEKQIRDTAVIYYKSDFKRQLSLKFLAYVMLKEKVQKGNHDSIEDANTALLLYKKYQNLYNKEDFESILNYIYSEGQQLRFKVPE
ncbi:pab1p-dependent poly(a)-nuclease, putative [Candida dubliniensis CD36]|uniref:PAN2-PAN3 deadenylation complex catalytic subunit PAN2 n=1 Tax=Candida dubliniensis (strain CD36 / ATCC MYA-646 / CBS 7987 / NCPF 3949 / NRRL Y-17841) TaxID=573826 RepID=B9W8T0_CANDC|nr:pab1p-dependent poly(a)-nuclease, putative [Candida dubliniensis CD36]CAX45153.1 pab1p-dependent poly(a)-nuclease, putative [Candida dubliniensis CD36]